MDDHTRQQRVIHIIIFKRTENSEWERGICIGPNADDHELIIDKDYKVVPSPVWDFSSYTPYYEGCITLKL